VFAGNSAVGGRARTAAEARRFGRAPSSTMRVQTVRIMPVGSLRGKREQLELVLRGNIRDQHRLRAAQRSVRRRVSRSCLRQEPLVQAF
jgi:hypothetical protein